MPTSRGDAERVTTCAVWVRWITNKNRLCNEIKPSSSFRVPMAGICTNTASIVTWAVLKEGTMQVTLSAGKSRAKELPA